MSVHSRPHVLGADTFKFPTPTADRDQTVSRRFKPSSRTTLNGEQPYPWDRLQPQDVMSRHRGAKLPRRYELLGGISLLSPEYLDRKSTRLNSSHVSISYAVFCLKKKQLHSSHC